jgi:hypothetical protein
MRTRSAALALLLVPVLSACNGNGNGNDPAAGPAASSSAAAAAPGAKYTRFATPCPTVGDRPGEQVDPPLDTPISVTAECTYGDRTTFPHVNSIATINKAGNPKGAADQVATEMFGALRSKAASSAEKRPGLGDEAFLVVSYDDNVALMVVRSSNALIQASATLDAEGDREKALAALRAQEPVVTELSRALLAELR